MQAAPILTGALTGTLLTLLCSTPFAGEDDAAWPWWRGPDHNGISTETNWNSEIAAEPLWSLNVGMGYSTVSIADGRLFTQGHSKDDQTDWILCLEPETGKEMWRYEFPAKTMGRGHRGGSLSTPSIDGDQVYALNREGNFYRFEAATGKVVWHQDLMKEHELKLPTWGFSASPHIFDDMIVLNLGKVFAFDRKGKVLWQTDANYGDAYATTAEIEVQGKSCLAVFAGSGLALIQRKDGKELDTFEWKTKYDINAATPVVVGTKLFISSGYNHGCAMLETKKGKLELLWENKEMRNQMSGCVLYEDHLYGMDDKDLKCLDLDGNVRWSKERIHQGCVFLAGDRLIVMGGKGTLHIVKATPEGFEELSQRKILDGGKYWTTPVLLNGLLYCRNSNGDLVCLDQRIK